MPSKNHYIYDPDQCEFVPVKYDIKKKLINSISFWLINGLVMAIFGLAVLTNYVGTPAEIALKDENRILVEHLKNTETSLIELEKKLEDIAELDNEMYRTILGLDPVSEDLRMAGTGGANIYSDFDYFNRETSEILRSTASKIDKLERRIGVQRLSFDEIKGHYNNNKERLRKIPAIKPVNSIILDGFGMRTHPVLGYKRQHDGVDFRAEINSEVFATGDGKVVYASRHGSYGNLLEIDHGFGIVTRYAHLNRFADGIRPGTKVKRGEMVAYTGNTGLSSGPHLHYEVLVDGKPVDPINYMIADITPEEYLMFKELNENQESLFSISIPD